MKLVRFLTWPWRFAWDAWKYAVASAAYEGWGMRDDPRNERPELTREQWKTHRHWTRAMWREGRL